MGKHFFRDTDNIDITILLSKKLIVRICVVGDVLHGLDYTIYKIFNIIH